MELMGGGSRIPALQTKLAEAYGKKYFLSMPLCRLPIHCSGVPIAILNLVPSTQP